MQSLSYSRRRRRRRRTGRDAKDREVRMGWSVCVVAPQRTEVDASASPGVHRLLKALQLLTEHVVCACKEIRLMLQKVHSCAYYTEEKKRIWGYRK
jgi:hypothetical protein